MGNPKRDWKKLYDEFCRSGKSEAEFASTKKLPLSSLYKNFRRIIKEETADKAFIPVKITDTEKQSSDPEQVIIEVKRVSMSFTRDLESSGLAELASVIRECLD